MFQLCCPVILVMVLRPGPVFLLVLMSRLTEEVAEYIYNSTKRSGPVPRLLAAIDSCPASGRQWWLMMASPIGILRRSLAVHGDYATAESH